MKSLKKMLAGICTVAIAATMFVGVTAQAAEVDTPLVKLSTQQTTALKNDNTMDIVFETTVTSTAMGALYVTVPNGLQNYIDSWTWSSPLTVTPVTGYTEPWVTDADYKLISASVSNATAVETNGVLGTLTIKFKEGGVPSTVSEADRTIKMGGDYKKTKKQSTYVKADDGTLVYSINSNATGTTSISYWTLDYTRAGDFVVVPAVKTEPTEKIPTAAEATPVYDGTPANWQGTTATAIGGTYVSESDANDTAVAYGVGIKGDGNAHTKLIWKVTAKGETKGHEMNLDSFNGEGTAKVGLAIQGLTAADVESVSVAFGD